MKKHTMGQIEKDLGRNKKFPSNKGTNRRTKKTPMMKGKKEQKDLLAE